MDRVCDMCAKPYETDLTDAELAEFYENMTDLRYDRDRIMLVCDACEKKHAQTSGKIH